MARLPRVGGRLGILLAVISAALSSAASASANDFSVDLEHHANHEFTAFFVDGGPNCRGYSCSGTFVVTHGSRQLASEQLSSVDEYRRYQDYSWDASYDWTCKETGTLGWHMTLTRPNDPATPEDESAARQASGTFRLGRCTSWKPLRVYRGHAAAWAADGYGSEYVSRSRCSARKNPSRAWTCDVTHNNTYRECTDRYHVKFRGRLRFGRREEDQKYSEKTVRCRYF
jgi:hypothetical protein